ncbi:MAG: CYTH domain-containing protein, partial [bacterium]
YDYAEEYETEISNPDELRKILDFLDFKKMTTVDKQREYWDCGNFEIALDIVKNLGYFIEVEATGNFESPAQAKQACLDFLESIGIKNAESVQIKKGYPVMLLEKK